ncbi:MAG: PAS-domain containing protein [Pseudomonadota bacterium]
MDLTRRTPHRTVFAEPDIVLSALNLIQQAISIFDEDLKLVACNEKFATMFHLPPEATQPGADFELSVRVQAERGEYGEGDVEQMVTERVRLARAFAPHYFERQRPNGDHISVEGFPLAEGGWVAVYTDISAYKRQEAMLQARSDGLSDQLWQRHEALSRSNRELTSTIEDLKESRRALARSEARLRLIAEATPGHLAYLDQDGMYRYSNRRLDTVLMRGTNPVGQHFSAAQTEDVYTAISAAVGRAMAGEPMTVDYEASDAAGDARYLRSIITPDRGDADSILGLYVLTLDMTEERRTAEALLQARKMETAATLTSGLAHDFSNLLTIVMGIHGRLERLPDLPPDAHDMIAAAHVATARGAELLRHLAAISGDRQAAPERVDIADTLRGVAELFRTTDADMADMVVDLLLEPMPETEMDRGYLQDAVLNLLLNARDAFSGEAGLRIKVSAARVGPMIRIAVGDNGPGFAATARERAFEPFFSTKARGGAGLGLSTVFNFANSCGGTARIGTSPLGGAEVELLMPHIEPAALNDPGPDLSASLEAGIALVVDDDPAIRTGVRDDLHGLGWPVLEAASAEEAFALVSQIDEITLVVSDLMMGTGDTGAELAARLRRMRPDLRVLLMTGLPVGNALRRNAEAAFPVISKPFTSTTLAAHLNPAMS